jgi:hypothetical protein
MRLDLESAEREEGWAISDCGSYYAFAALVASYYARVASKDMSVYV